MDVLGIFKEDLRRVRSGSAGRWCLGIWGDRVSAGDEGIRGYAAGRLGADA